MNDRPLSLADFTAALQAAAQDPGGSVELLLRTLPPRKAALLRAAAIPHDFDADLLQVLEPGLGQTQAETLCTEFLKLSMVTTVEGALKIHDQARQHLFRSWLGADRREAFRDLSGRLAAHFEALKQTAVGAAQSVAENRQIFHLIGANEAAGFEAFKTRFQSARKQFELAECEALLRLVREYGESIEPVRRLWIIHLEGDLRADLRRFDEAKAAYQAVLADPQATPELRARSWYRIGNLEREQRHWAEAETAYGEARNAAAAVKSEGLGFRITDGLTAVYRETGRLDEAEAMLERAIKRAGEVGNRASLTVFYNSMGMLLQKRGDTGPAIEAFKQSLARLHEEGETFRQAQVLNNLGLAYADRTEWAESQRYLEDCLRIEEQRGHTLGQAKTLHNLVRAYIALGQESKGLETAERAAGLFVDVRDWFHAAVVKRMMGRIQRRARRYPEARKAFGESLGLFQQAGDDGEAAATQVELNEVERRRRLPWYIWVALVLFGLLVLVFLLAIAGDL